MLYRMALKALKKPSRIPGYLKRFLRNPRFGLLKFRTNGMLSPYLYRKLYTETLTLSDLPFVDIGAASGTTTIAVALAFKRSGKNAWVIGVEKCRGGSRDAYGSYGQNLATLERNLTKYGVRGRVRLHTESLEEDDASIWGAIESRELSGFMHDADGRLYRDFGLFYERTVKGGLIVVDDCPAGSSTAELLARGYTGKFVRAGVQWDWIERNGLVERVERVGDTDTVFARKSMDPAEGSPNFGDLKAVAADVDRVLEEYSRNEA